MLVFANQADADFGWDEDEPPFTPEELEQAAFFLTVQPHTTLARQDRCPHPEKCPDPETCIRNIAWYRRYQAHIEAALTAAGKQP